MRTQKDIEAYQAWQSGNRQLNRETLEYEKMKTHYAGREDEMPYKTLGAFRKARRSDNLSPAFKAWRYRNADKQQYERWKEIVGEENMPKSVDDFQEIKYNKSKQEEFQLLQHYKWAVDKGQIAAISSFANYKEQYNKINETLVGKTFNGVEIKKVSNHFIDRTVGSIYYTYTRNGGKIKHEGVSVEDSFKTLLSGQKRSIQYDKHKRPSQKFLLLGVAVLTINPITGELVQVNRCEDEKN